MEQDFEYRQQVVAEYREIVMPLLRYLPWLEQNKGQSGSTLYSGVESTEHSLSFPVYDGTLMQFVKLASASKLMDRNYRYVYSRNHIATHADEEKLIAAAQIQDWGILCGILSNYVLGGRTKGILWSEGLKLGIYYRVLSKMKEIIEFWDKPIDAR